MGFVTDTAGSRSGMWKSILRGLAAGAAGTTALNVVTYLDMTLRGRPPSSTPEKTVETLSEKTGLPVPGERDQRENRVSGLGALMGLLTGAAVGAGYGALRSVGWRPSVPVGGFVAGVAALVGSGAPMTVLGVTIRANGRRPIGRATSSHVSPTGWSLQVPTRPLPAETRFKRHSSGHSGRWSDPGGNDGETPFRRQRQRQRQEVGRA